MTSNVITEQESLMRIDMLTRERDLATQRLCAEMNLPSPVEMAEEEERAIAGFLRRIGYQNGMAGIEEMEAKHG